MTKSDKLRDLQTEINRLLFENKRLKEQLETYKSRDRPRLMDFVKVKRCI